MSKIPQKELRDMTIEPNTSHEDLVTRFNLEMTVVESATQLASEEKLDGTQWKLALWEDLENTTQRRLIDDLVTRSNYPNIFFDWAFLQNSSRLIARHNVKFLFLSAQYGEHLELKFFAPVTLERVGPMGTRYFRVWSSEFSPLGHPLVDDETLEETVEELLNCFSKVPKTTAQGILINSLPKNTGFTRNLFKRQTNSDVFTFFNHYERASLLPMGGKEYTQTHLSGKRRQRLNVARRRLDAIGDVSIDHSTTSTDIEVALLDFLYLEKRGWKGKRNTALASQDDTRQLAMDVVRELAIQGSCEIFTMTMDGNAIAAIIVLKSQGNYIAWKITYDEKYAAHSVGNLLVVHATSEISGRDDFRFLDSVAVGDNETANRFWPDRLAICSLAIGFGEKAAAHSKQIALNLSFMMRLKRGLRKLIKR